jgi:hypothetical protein
MPARRRRGAFEIMEDLNDNVTGVLGISLTFAAR